MHDWIGCGIQECTVTKKHPKKIAIAGGDARIELATSCTLSRNHTTRPITRIYQEESRRAILNNQILSLGREQHGTCAFQVCEGSWVC